MNRKEMLARLKAGEDPLQVSIEKWREIKDGKGDDFSVLNCALCETFKDCVGCPVAEIGYKQCKGTPYHAYVMLQAFDGCNPETLAAIEDEEIRFLTSLRRRKET